MFMEMWKAFLSVEFSCGPNLKGRLVRFFWYTLFYTGAQQIPGVFPKKSICPTTEPGFLQEKFTCPWCCPVPREEEHFQRLRWLHPWTPEETSTFGGEKKTGIMGCHPGGIFCVFFLFFVLVRLQNVFKMMLTFEQWKKPGWLGYIGDEILPNYLGIIINHYKDPY